MLGPLEDVGGNIFAWLYDEQRERDCEDPEDDNEV